MTLVQELLAVREKLQEFIENSAERGASTHITKLEDAANAIGKAWSGSWLGYQSCVYYENLKQPPAGAHFSSEWGFKTLNTIRTTTGNWREFTFDDVWNAIFKQAGNTDLGAIDASSARAGGLFVNSRSEILSILQIDSTNRKDRYTERLLDEVQTVVIPTKAEIEESWKPTDSMMSRDALAVTQGIKTPPHIAMLAQANAISHMERRERAKAREERVGRMCSLVMVAVRFGEN
jgi:hypothetical protein